MMTQPLVGLFHGSQVVSPFWAIVDTCGVAVPSRWRQSDLQRRQFFGFAAWYVPFSMRLHAYGYFSLSVQDSHVRWSPMHCLWLKITGHFYCDPSLLLFPERRDLFSSEIMCRHRRTLQCTKLPPPAQDWSDKTRPNPPSAFGTEISMRRRQNFAPLTLNQICQHQYWPGIPETCATAYEIPTFCPIQRSVLERFTSRIINKHILAIHNLGFPPASSPGRSSVSNVFCLVHGLSNLGISNHF